MGQEEIYKFLKERKDWVKTKEIIKEMGVMESAISRCLHRLSRYGEVEWRYVKRKPREKGNLQKEWRIKNETIKKGKDR